MFARTAVPPHKLVPLIPRLYQTEVFRMGIEKNIMIRLDTGLGKTFIASMIIRHFASIPDLTKKLIVFIVPTVSLALQQGRTLGETTLLKVKAFVGYHGVDYWKRDQWISELAGTDVAIFTAQIWLDVLDNAYWDLSRVKLMVLDEAHHTRKAHPYCKIMQMHYHINKQEGKSVPRICAMTASPFFNLKRPEASLRTLESNLDAVTYEVKEGQTDLETFSRKPDEKTILYDDPLLWSETLTETLTFVKDLLSSLEASEAADKVLLYMRKMYERALAVASKLGLLAADLYVSAVFYYSELLEPYVKSLEDVHQHPSYDSTLVTPHVQALLKELDRTFKPKGATCVVFVEQRYEAFVLSRIVELWQRSIYAPHQSLEDYCSNEKRHIQTGYIVGFKGGGSSTGYSSLLENMKNEFGQTSREQSRQVTNFTSGKINLLFATKVAEEGLDFQSCNSVMRFDPIDTFTGYIQSRGRARKNNSEFVVFVSRNKQASDKFRVFQGSERQMKNLFANREHLVPEMPVLETFPRFNVLETGALLSYHNAVSLLFEFCSLLPYDMYAEARQPTLTMLKLYSEEDAIQAEPDGEVCDLADALDKMHVFNCEEKEANSDDALDCPETSGAISDEAPGIFQTVIELPLIPAFPTRKRIVGPPMRTKKLARQGAAYLMCLKLYNVGSLDKHLMPIRHYRGKGAVDVSGKYVDREEYQDHYEMTEDNIFGNMWDDKSPVYLNVFEARIVRQTGEEGFEFTGQTEGIVKKEPELVSEPGAYTIRFGWVCGSPLSYFHKDKLFAPNADERLLITFISSSKLDWSTEQKRRNLDALADFNATLIRARVNHRFNLKKGENQFSLWAPLVDDTIAWDQVREPSTKLTRQSDLSTLRPGQLLLVQVNIQNRLSLFSFDSIRKDVTSNSRTADVLRIRPRAEPGPGDVTELFPFYKNLARANFGRHTLEIKCDESNNLIDDEYPIMTLRRLNQHVPNLLTQRWAQVTSQQYSPDTGEYIGNGLEEHNDKVFLDDFNHKTESLGETFQVPDVYQKGSLGVPKIYEELHGGLSNAPVELPVVDLAQTKGFKTLGAVVTTRKGGKTGTTGEAIRNSGGAVSTVDPSPDPHSVCSNLDPDCPEDSEARRQSEHEMRRYAHVPPMACAVSHIPHDFWRLVSYLPSIDRLVTDNIRVAKTIQRMEFPDIDIPTMREALTPTGANTGYDYQILETMGDSFLKFSTTIHSYLTLRNYNEGELSVVRDNSVDNRFLCQQSVASDFLHAILVNRFRTRTWCVPLSDNAVVSPDGLSALRGVNRRAVCDTVESVLGAAYLTRGINAGLEVGARLGLCFGGAEPWSERLPEPRHSPVPAALRALEDTLGYTFRDGTLLLQAVTHRSYTSALTHCYEREEYLGDAVLDFWATNTIYRHCPGCTPRFLTFTRAMLVSNSALGFLGIRSLGVQSALLHTSETLADDIAAAVSDAEALEWSEVLKDMTWFWHAPKVLGDVVEALIGAVFVDSGFNVDTVFRVLDTLYAPITALLGRSERRDPYTTLIHWIQGHGCCKAGVRVQLLDSHSRERVSMVTYHGKIIGRAVSVNIGVARQLASRQALDWLRSEEAAVDGRLDVCDCKAGRAQSATATLQDKELQEHVEDSPLPEKAVGAEDPSKSHDPSLEGTPDVFMGTLDNDSDREPEFAEEPGDSATKYLIEEVISNTVEGAEEAEDTSHSSEDEKSDSALDLDMTSRHLPAEGEALEWLEERDSVLKKNNRTRQYG